MPDFAAYPFTPYCGAPPVPQSIATHWNLDPVLIGALVAAALAYAAFTEPSLWGDGRIAAWRRRSFYAGWALLALALVSPLCSLSVALFSARIAQHMVLAAVAAPLVALGNPEHLFKRVTRRDHPAMPLFAAGAVAAALWFWHAPAPYAATFRSDLVYWTMHGTSFGAALWLWSSLLDRREDRLGFAVIAAVVTGVQMSLLGAVITFANRPLFAPHALTTQAWGLTPIQDQQLGGAIMWAPAGVIFVGALVFALAEALRRAELRAAGAAS